MHIPDGILSPPIWIGGYAVTTGVMALTLRQVNKNGDPSAQIPKASLLTAAFFVGSSLYLPFGPTSIHLLLNGIVGIVLGIYAFPAIFVGLVFQALMIGHGGLTTLGVNSLILGIPALIARPLFLLYPRWQGWLGERWALGISAFGASALSTGLTVLIFFGLLMTTLDARLDAVVEQRAILILALSHIPLMLLEGSFATFLVLFLQQVRPELLQDS